MGLGKWVYYGRSIPLMLGGFTNWTSIVPALLTGRGRIVRLRDRQFFYRDAMDVWTIKETCLDDHYRLVGRQLGAGSTVLDVGAGLGDFAISVARHYPGTRVLAFEPFPASAALCRRNIQVNQAHNVSIFEAAVGGSDGVVALDMSSSESVQYSTATKTHASPTITVVKRRLAGIFEAYGITRCDLLKLDCEGAEFEILFALNPATLKHIQAITMEYHDGVTAHTHAELVAFLREAGFVVEVVANPVHNHLGYLYAQRV